jgi:hypothetical protein
VYNIVSAFWALSKFPASRDYLETPVNLSASVADLSKTDNAKLKANVARLQKNLQSDVNEAIEEGAVAALIAVSLEGKAQRQKAGNEMRIPEIMPVGAPIKLNCGVETFDGSPYLFHIEKEVVAGGAAGKGPELPEPPAMEVSGKTYAQFSVDELDGGEVEGKAKMSFAKMQIPSEVKTLHLFVDADFDIKEDDVSVADDGSVGQAAGGGGSGGETSFIAGGDLDDSAIMDKGDKVGHVHGHGHGHASTDKSPKLGASDDRGASSSDGGRGRGEAKESSSSGSPKAESKHSASAAHSTRKKKGEGDVSDGGAVSSKPNTPAASKKVPSSSSSKAASAQVDKSNKEIGSKAAQLGLYK